MHGIKLKPITAVLLSAILASALSGCSEKASAESDDLLEDITPATMKFPDAYSEEDNTAAMDFSLRLFELSLKDNNTLISPMSVLSALGMTANGAEGDTLKQMERVFGLKLEELNSLLANYLNNLPHEDQLKVSMANSIWFREGHGIDVNSAFLEIAEAYYNVGIYRASFDENTLKDINDWVKDETDGLIENILDRISEDAMMYLINALSFDAEWEEPYFDYDVNKGIFHAADGTRQSVDMMHSGENLYMEDGEAKGFLKNYAEGKYVFAAILPSEDLSVYEYISTLTGEKLRSLLKNAEDTTVNAMIPKFSTEDSLDMADLLSEMGIQDLFDPEAADLKKLGTAQYNLYVSRVVHKTRIQVDEKGTKAGAATVVEVLVGSAAPEEMKTVYLDRPFLYLIVDTGTYLPLFIGTTLSVK